MGRVAKLRRLEFAGFLLECELVWAQKFLKKKLLVYTIFSYRSMQQPLLWVLFTFPWKSTKRARKFEINVIADVTRFILKGFRMQTRASLGWGQRPSFEPVYVCKQQKIKTTLFWKEHEKHRISPRWFLPLTSRIFGNFPSNHTFLWAYLAKSISEHGLFQISKQWKNNHVNTIPWHSFCLYHTFTEWAETWHCLF